MDGAVGNEAGGEVQQWKIAQIDFVGLVRDIISPDDVKSITALDDGASARDTSLAVLEAVYWGLLKPALGKVNSASLQKAQGTLTKSDKRLGNKAALVMGVNEQPHVSISAKAYQFSPMVVFEFVSTPPFSRLARRLLDSNGLKYTLALARRENHDFKTFNSARVRKRARIHKPHTSSPLIAVMPDAICRSPTP